MKTFYKIIRFKWNAFFESCIVYISILTLLLWMARIRKLTPEEILFKRDIEKMERLKEIGLLTEEECKERKVSLWEEFLHKFKRNRKRTVVYKVIRIGSLVRDGLIVGEEFGQAIARILENTRILKSNDFKSIVEVLGTFKEKGFISEEEFKKGKAQLSEKTH